MAEEQQELWMGFVREDKTYTKYCDEFVICRTVGNRYVCQRVLRLNKERFGFLLLDKDDKLKVVLHIENETRWAVKKYKKLRPDKLLPHIITRMFCHTFCTIRQKQVWISGIYNM